MSAKINKKYKLLSFPCFDSKRKYLNFQYQIKECKIFLKGVINVYY